MDRRQLLALAGGSLTATVAGCFEQVDRRRGENKTTEGDSGGGSNTGDESTDNSGDDGSSSDSETSEESGSDDSESDSAESEDGTDESEETTDGTDGDDSDGSGDDQDETSDGSDGSTGDDSDGSDGGDSDGSDGGDSDGSDGGDSDGSDGDDTDGSDGDDSDGSDGDDTDGSDGDDSDGSDGDDSDGSDGDDSDGSDGDDSDGSDGDDSDDGPSPVSFSSTGTDGFFWTGESDESVARDEGIGFVPPDEENSDPVQIDGSVENGTWESTSVFFPELPAADDVWVKITAPNGLRGEFDPDANHMTFEGDLKVSFVDFDTSFTMTVGAITGPSNALTGSFTVDTESGTAFLVDNEYIVDDQTDNELINNKMSLPSTVEGENWFELELTMDITYE